MVECDELRELVVRALSDRVRTTRFEYGCEISLPLLDSVNDWLTCYLVETTKGVKLTDFGETMARLRDEFGVEAERGYTVASDIARVIERYSGLRFQDGEVYVDFAPTIKEDERADVVLRYVNALTRLHALSFTSRRGPSVDFRGEVMDYLEEKGIAAIPSRVFEVPTVGQVSVDLLVGSKGIATATLYAGTDTSARIAIEHRIVAFQLLKRLPRHPELALIYDDESVVAGHRELPVLEELLTYESIPWSLRDERIQELA